MTFPVTHSEIHGDDLTTAQFYKEEDPVYEPLGVGSLQTQGVGPQRSRTAAAGRNEPVDQRRFAAQGVELIYLALNCACTNLDEAGTRRQIRAALDAGATRDEILLVPNCGAGLAVDSCSLGAPILLGEMKAANVTAASGPKPETPACDAMRAIGRWNAAWDPFYELSPFWTDEFLAFGASVYKAASSHQGSWS